MERGGGGFQSPETGVISNTKTGKRVRNTLAFLIFCQGLPLAKPSCQSVTDFLPHGVGQGKWEECSWGHSGQDCLYKWAKDDFCVLASTWFVSLLQAGPISSKASRHQTEVFTHSIISKIAQASRFLSHLESSCFAHPVKPHTASAGHW